MDRKAEKIAEKAKRDVVKVAKKIKEEWISPWQKMHPLVEMTMSFIFNLHCHLVVLKSGMPRLLGPWSRGCRKALVIF
jgi:hypothetical protein